MRISRESGAAPEAERPLRLAMISTPFVEVPPRRYGGTELVVHELVEGLVGHGHEVTLYTVGESRSRARLRTYFRSPHWPPDPLPDLDHVSWAMREAVEAGHELIHAHSAAALALGRMLPAGIPLVYTLHHDRNELLSSYYEHFPDTYFVAISADQRRREICLPRTAVIHHGLDPAKYVARAGEPHGPDGDGYVCFLGRLARVKGPHTAIDVAREAGVQIRVAGEVHQADAAFSAEEIRSRLGLPHVRYLGPVGLEEKVALLSGARALLAPLEWNEPFGLVFLEAMLAGCPVAAYPRGSLPELVEPGVTGFLVRDAREMTELIRPGGPLESFDRERCRRRAAERFSSERMVQAHETLYRHAVARARRSRGEDRTVPSALRRL